MAFIDGALDGWSERVRHALGDGQNFFVLIREGDAEALADALEIPLRELPSPSTKAVLLSNSRFVNPGEFRLPETSKDGREQVYHIEQLHLSRTVPPVVRPYLLYCYVRGIVSQHDLPSDARVACDAYNNDRFARGNYPEAAVYRWEHDEWRRTRLC